MKFRSKRQIFIVCLGISMLLHALLLILAPQVTLLGERSPLEPRIDRIRIQLRDDIPTPPPETVEEETESTPPLISRPGSVSDLLALRDEYIPAPMEDTPAAPMATPDIAERVARNIPQLPFELERNPDLVNRVDARILEIREETARQDIEVPRRLVRPSTERLLDPNELPNLRSQLPESGEVPFAFRDQPQSLLFQELPDRGDSELGRILGARPLDTGIEGGDSGAGSTGRGIDPGASFTGLGAAQRAAQDETPFEFWDDMLDIRLYTYLPEGQREGYFRLQITPKPDAAITALPRQVMFVVDCSNSMTQIKLNAIIRAMRRMIPTLYEGDTFNIVTFRDRPNFFKTEPIAGAPGAQEEALRFVGNLESRGSTDFYSALLPVVQQPVPANRVGQIFVVSDGHPTTGLQDARAIINGLTSDNNLNYRIFAIGGGNNVNRSLMDLLAYRNKGEVHISDTVAGLSDELPQFYEQFREPILTDPQANFAHIDTSGIFPRILSDLYRNRPLNIFGRYVDGAQDRFVVRLSGRRGEERKEVLFQQAFSEAETGDAGIPARWAFQKAYHLIGEMSRQGETPELREALNDLGVLYNIRTSYDE